MWHFYYTYKCKLDFVLRIQLIQRLYIFHYIPPKLLSFSNVSIEFNKPNLSMKHILKTINLESDINELEMSLDHMNKANAEESKQIKR